MGIEIWVLIVSVAVLLCTVALVIPVVWALRNLQRETAAQEGATAGGPVEDTDAPAPQVPLIAFIANPSKLGVATLKPALLTRCQAEGLAEPLWLETTIEDPGTGQAKQALASGAQLVVALGGDGTVRAVARALVNSEVPMGILPMGTGNLLARNLDISISDREEAFEVLLNGVDRPIDVGWLQAIEPDASEVERLEKIVQTTKYASVRNKALGRLEISEHAPADTEQHLFLVISGVGFDAAMIAEADAALKAKVGWIAYFLAGARHLHGPRIEAHITLDSSRHFTTKLRTLMVGNCGRLPGGITLIPDAVIDDGIHDIAAIDTRGGIAGWVQLFGEVMMQGFGMHNDLTAKVGRIDHTQAKTTTITITGGAQAQVDGDVIGRAKKIQTWVEPLALIVRAPIPRLDLK
ncbi:diacylglycerol kinase family protein [Jonesiaceae bacterium BS-20]|uniref:Diacylglycerol kinase family protein n=1 Tax=Jonesiaceae bacterium BS-20 TaxID=3120821 RepID=A0AAU7DSX5_9MICO